MTDPSAQGGRHAGPAAGSDLEGKVCMVVGGGSIAPGWGIGKAICVAYARAGAKVLVCDRSLPAATETAEIVRGEGGSALPLEVDAVDPDSVQAAVDAAAREFGGLDVLHNNVGIGKAGESSKTSPQEWRAIADANLLALHISAQCAIPAMKKRGGGVILTTSSITSKRFIGLPHLAYSVTKAAANHFSRCLAVEYAADGIRSNALVAGLIDTPRIRVTLQKTYGLDEEAMVERRNRQVPLGFMGDGWDIANAAVFLASDKARYITGTELLIDGGLSVAARQ